MVVALARLEEYEQDRTIMDCRGPAICLVTCLMLLYEDYFLLVFKHFEKYLYLQKCLKHSGPVSQTQIHPWTEKQVQCRIFSPGLNLCLGELAEPECMDQHI